MEQYKFSQYNIVIDIDEKYKTIYNSYSGGIVKLENNVYSDFKSRTFLLNDIACGQELLENGFIVNSYVDEYNKVKMHLESTLCDRLQEIVSYVIAPILLRTICLTKLKLL